MAHELQALIGIFATNADLRAQAAYTARILREGSSAAADALYLAVKQVSDEAGLELGGLFDADGGRPEDFARGLEEALTPKTP